MKLDFLKKYDNPKWGILAILIIYTFISLSQWRKYEWNPSSMIHFGFEFVEQNRDETPRGAIVEKGALGDLGSGYDGQIFYYYSRTVSKFSNDWPRGFDESYRAPRIGFPFLVGIFGIFGQWGSIFGMYFWNISLFLLSYLALREILGKEYSHLAWFYILSPFSLGSYTVLVSDSVMTSLVILSYYFYLKEKWIPFILLSSLAILTKEPSLFLYFPLGLLALSQKDVKRMALVGATLLLPVLWHTYLKITFPNWSPTRLADFIQPLEGILGYFKSIGDATAQGGGLREWARLFSRFPLLLLLILGLVVSLGGSFRMGWVFRLGLLFDFFMISTASYYHFWSVYENISRMFTVSIPLILLLEKEEGQERTKWYLVLSVFIFLLFVLRVAFIQKTQEYFLWQGI